MNIKKLSITTGSILISVTPIVGVISCTNNIEVSRYPLLPTYTGQADQLLALNIIPDYYPLQLGAKEPYAYLRPGLRKYMYDPESKFAHKFENKIISMMNAIPTKGTSWWNQQALEPGERGSDPSYWQRQKGDVVLYEHYLLDDDEKVIDSNTAPRHYWETAVETNFRWSRDPFTRLSKGVIYGLDLINIKDGVWSKKPNFDTDTSVTVSGETVKVTPADKRVLESFIRENVSGTKGSWVYNSKYFAELYHRMFLDNREFSTSDFANWIIDSSKEHPFAFDNTENQLIKKLFAASTYTQEEKDAGIHSPSYLRHHPIYEQQDGEVGAAPMFEGAIRDNMLYLFNVAWQIDNLASFGTPYGSAAYNAGNKANFDKVKAFVASHLRKDQLKGMINAFQNANKISEDLRHRLKSMQKYIAELGASNKTFGIITVAPGHGMSTIQSMSKYSFIYKELGLRQPMPDNLAELSQNADTLATQKDALFNMDDNGWWWNLGEPNQISEHAKHFKNTFDMGVLVARDINYDSVIDQDRITKEAISNIYKDSVNLETQKVDYDLWSEGIKTPFVFHMVLDQIIKVVESWYLKNHENLPTSVNKTEALSWGQYFTQDYFK